MYTYNYLSLYIYIYVCTFYTITLMKSPCRALGPSASPPTLRARGADFGFEGNIYLSIYLYIYLSMHLSLSIYIYI